MTACLTADRCGVSDASVGARVVARLLLLAGLLFVGLACAASYQAARASDTGGSSAGSVEQVVIPLVGAVTRVPTTLTEAGAAAQHLLVTMTDTLASKAAPVVQVAPAATDSDVSAPPARAAGSPTSARSSRLQPAVAPQQAPLQPVLSIVADAVPAVAPVVTTVSSVTAAVATPVLGSVTHVTTSLTAAVSSLTEPLALTVHSLAVSVQTTVGALVLFRAEPTSPGDAAASTGRPAAAAHALSSPSAGTPRTHAALIRAPKGIAAMTAGRPVCCHAHAAAGGHAAPAQSPAPRGAGGGALSLTAPAGPAGSGGGHVDRDAGAGFAAALWLGHVPNGDLDVIAYESRMPRSVGSEPGHAPD